MQHPISRIIFINYNSHEKQQRHNHLRLSRNGHIRTDILFFVRRIPYGIYASDLRFNLLCDICIYTLLRVQKINPKNQNEIKQIKKEAVMGMDTKHLFEKLTEYAILFGICAVFAYFSLYPYILCLSNYSHYFQS